MYFVFVFVYLPTARPTDLSLTDNFHKFQLKIRLQTLRKQKTKAVNCDKKMCCVSARRLSIHKTYNKFRISLLNNCKKDFQFYTESKFFYTEYKIFFT
jgi:hypothetical protein